MHVLRLAPNTLLRHGRAWPRRRGARWPVIVSHLAPSSPHATTRSLVSATPAAAATRAPASASLPACCCCCTRAGSLEAKRPLLQAASTSKGAPNGRDFRPRCIWHVPTHALTYSHAVIRGQRERASDESRRAAGRVRTYDKARRRRRGAAGITRVRSSTSCPSKLALFARHAIQCPSRRPASNEVPMVADNGSSSSTRPPTC